jgi:hypothetical protein
MKLQGTTMKKLQVNINGIKNGKNKDYLGFMIFPKSVCGKDFIAKVMDNTVQFDFMDKFHNKNDPAGYYDSEAGFKYDSAQQSLTIQWKHSSESAAQTTLGSTTKDIAYLLVSGIDQVDFGSKNMNACLKGAMVGYMLPGSGYDATKDYTCIAGK